MKKFFSLFAAVLFAGSMMAESVTLTMSDFAATSFTDQASGISVATAKNSGSTEPAYNATGADLRVYAKGSITISASKNITAISFTISTAGKKRLAPLTANVGEVAVAGTPNFTAEWTGSATSVTLTVGDKADYGTDGNTKAGQLDFTAMVVTLEDGGSSDPVVEYYVVGTMNNWTPAAAYKLAANPGQAGEYIGEFTFAANDEIKVRRTTDGEADAWFPEGMGNNYVINEAGDYTVYFRPEGNTEWGNGYFDAVKKEPAQPITCAEVYNLAKNDNVELLNDVVVTFANGKNVWVKDETASMLIYFSANTTYAAGDVLSGIAGVVDVYNGIHEVKPSADQAAAIVATPGEAPAAEAVTAVVAADVNKYIVMKGVEAEGTFAEGAQSNITINNVTVRNQFKNGYVFEAGNHYDVYGVVTLYQSNPQVYFITAVEVDPTAIDNTNIDAKAVKFFENGQLIIIKNGVRYNAQGAVVR